MVTSRISRPQVTPAPEETSLDALVQISFHVMGILSQVAAEHDLSLTQLRVLAILRDHEPTMSELADHLGLDRSSVSGLIDRAEKRGLVRRIASETDKRSSRATLTTLGQAFAAAGATVVAARYEPPHSRPLRSRPTSPGPRVASRAERLTRRDRSNDRVGRR